MDLLKRMMNLSESESKPVFTFDIPEGPPKLINWADSQALAYLKNMQHGVIIFIGSGKRGKSATMHSMVQLCWQGRQVYILDILDIDTKIFPDYKQAKEVDDIEPGSIVIIEDAIRMFGSRGSSANAILQLWLPLVSHKKCVVIITVQSMSSTDIEFLRSQDCVVIHKQMFNEDISWERSEFLLVQAFVNVQIAKAVKKYPDIDERAWTFFDRWNELIAMPLVEWWGDQHSYMFMYVKLGDLKGVKLS